MPSSRARLPPCVVAALTLPKRWCPRSQSKRRAPGRGRPQLGLQSRAPRLPQRLVQALLLGTLTRAAFLRPSSSASSSMSPAWGRRRSRAQKLRLLRDHRRSSEHGRQTRARVGPHRCSILSRSACSQPASIALLAPLPCATIANLRSAADEVCCGAGHAARHAAAHVPALTSTPHATRCVRRRAETAAQPAALSPSSKSAVACTCLRACAPVRPSLALRRQVEPPAVSSRNGLLTSPTAAAYVAAKQRTYVVCRF